MGSCSRMGSVVVACCQVPRIQTPLLGPMTVPGVLLVCVHVVAAFHGTSRLTAPDMYALVICMTIHYCKQCCSAVLLHLTCSSCVRAKDQGCLTGYSPGLAVQWSLCTSIMADKVQNAILST